MYDVEKDMPTKVQSSSLNEELGKLKWILIANNIRASIIYIFRQDWYVNLQYYGF